MACGCFFIGTDAQSGEIGLLRSRRAKKWGAWRGSGPRQHPSSSGSVGEVGRAGSGAFGAAWAAEAGFGAGFSAFAAFSGAFATSCM